MPRVTRSGQESTAGDAEENPAQTAPNRPVRHTRPTMKAAPIPPLLPTLKPIPKPKSVTKKRLRATTESTLPVLKAVNISKAPVKASVTRLLKSILKKQKPAKITTLKPESSPQPITVYPLLFLVH